jgi:hypothetical protein
MHDTALTVGRIWDRRNKTEDENNKQSADKVGRTRNQHWPSLRVRLRRDRIRQVSTYPTNLGLEVSPNHLRR